MDARRFAEDVFRWPAGRNGTHATVTGWVHIDRDRCLSFVDGVPGIGSGDTHNVLFESTKPVK